MPRLAPLRPRSTTFPTSGNVAAGAAGLTAGASAGLASLIAALRSSKPDGLCAQTDVPPTSAALAVANKAIRTVARRPRTMIDTSGLLITHRPGQTVSPRPRVRRCRGSLLARVQHAAGESQHDVMHDPLRR